MVITSPITYGLLDRNIHALGLRASGCTCNSSSVLPWFLSQMPKGHDTGGEDRDQDDQDLVSGI